MSDLSDTVALALSLAGVSDHLSSHTGDFVARLVAAIEAGDWDRVEAEVRETIVDPHACRVALDALSTYRTTRRVVSWVRGMFR